MTDDECQVMSKAHLAKNDKSKTETKVKILIKNI